MFPASHAWSPRNTFTQPMHGCLGNNSTKAMHIFKACHIDHEWSITFLRARLFLLYLTTLNFLIGQKTSHKTDYTFTSASLAISIASFVGSHIKTNNDRLMQRSHKRGNLWSVRQTDGVTGLRALNGGGATSCSGVSVRQEDGVPEMRALHVKGLLEGATFIAREYNFRKQLCTHVGRKTIKTNIKVNRIDI